MFAFLQCCFSSNYVAAAAKENNGLWCHACADSLRVVLELKRKCGLDIPHVVTAKVDDSAAAGLRAQNTGCMNVCEGVEE